MSSLTPRMSRLIRSSIAPCKDCVDRCSGCHSTCDKYKEWTRNLHQQKYELRKKIHSEYCAEDYEIRERIKINKGVK